MSQYKPSSVSVFVQPLAGILSDKIDEHGVGLRAGLAEFRGKVCEAFLGPIDEDDGSPLERRTTGELAADA